MPKRKILDFYVTDHPLSKYHAFEKNLKSDLCHSQQGSRTAFLAGTLKSELSNYYI